MTGKPKEVDDKTDRDTIEPRSNDDVAERPYYYDDAHGYEEFDPADAEDSDEEGSDSTEN